MFWETHFDPVPFAASQKPMRSDISTKKVHIEQLPTHSDAKRQNQNGQ